MTRKIFNYFDKLEDKTRSKLSHNPLLYALVGAIGVVLFWRGIWHMADDIGMSSILSAILGAIILLVTGVFVSAFIGNRLIMTGLRGEKKLAEKTEDEIQTEETEIHKLQNTLSKVEQELSSIQAEIKEEHKKK
ncbi:MAG: hypothetical protein V4473_02055 [Patescibacteria group bacterium]